MFCFKGCFKSFCFFFLKFKWWRVITKVDSIWVKWIYSYELKHKNFWTASLPRKCSWGWKKILSSRTLALQKITYKGWRHSNFSLWHDPWCNKKPSSEQFDSGLQSALVSSTLDLVNFIMKMASGILALVTTLLLEGSEIGMLESFERGVLPYLLVVLMKLFGMTFGIQRFLSLSFIMTLLRINTHPPSWLDFNLSLRLRRSLFSKKTFD